MILRDKNYRLSISIYTWFLHGWSHFGLYFATFGTFPRGRVERQSCHDILLCDVQRRLMKKTRGKGKVGNGIDSSCTGMITFFD